MKAVRWLGLPTAVFLLLGLAGDAGAQTGPMVKVLIGVRHQPGPSEEDLVRRAGGRIKHTYHLVPAIAASVPEPAIGTLLANPIFASVHADGQVKAADLELDNAWGVQRIGAGAIHAVGNLGNRVGKGAGVRIAVLDTGIDYNHPDLKPNFAGGQDFVNDDNDPLDDNGHGTHMAGIIAARDDGIGVVGVAPEAQIFALKVLDETGSGEFSNVVAALEWGVDNQIEVTNNSFGGAEDPGPIVKAAFDIAAALGIVHVAAAGNLGNPLGVGDNVDFPARWDSVIAVTATQRDDARGPFSATGPAAELAAPGVDIASTFPEARAAIGFGTSQASAHVAGTAALVIASGITDRNRNGVINDEVRLRLDETAQDLGAPGRDPWFGFGLVDAARAAGNEPPAVTIVGPPGGSSFPSGATIKFVGTVLDQEDGELTSSLEWRSNLNGQIGTDGSFSRHLSDGSHTITAAVTDRGRKTGSASVTITVGIPRASLANT